MSVKPKTALVLLCVTGLVGITATLLLLSPTALAEHMGDADIVGAIMAGEIWAWGLVSAALATGLSSLGAGIAVGRVGVAAVGAITEKPDLFGRVLILVGLAEGIAIYGLIVSILILNRLV